MTNAPPRLTRAEQREQTLRRLLDAAETIFAEQGIPSSSIEDIADQAGFSRGAFYSNFADKDALVVALLQRTKERDAAEMEALLDQASDAADFFTRIRQRDEDPGRHTLSLEYILYAVRNPTARPEVARILAVSREGTARLVEAQWTEAGIDAPIDVMTAAKVIEALDDGLDIQRLIDPAGYPLGMFTDILVLLQEAVEALAEKRAKN